MPIKGLVDLIHEHQKPGMRVAEVGCFDGDTTKHYIELVANKSGHVYLVDWFQGNIGAGQGPHAHKPDAVEQVKAALQQNLAGFEDHYTIVQGTSWEMASRFPDEYFDICFIDADHRYVGVQKDLKAYYSKVKRHGIFCGHDCEDLELAGTFTEDELKTDWLERCSCHPGVIQAVHERFGDDVSVMGQGAEYCVWVHKKEMDDAV